MTGRHKNFTEEFKQEVVRLSHESGQTIERVANNLGIGKSTLTAWRRKFAEEDLLSGPPDDGNRKKYPQRVLPGQHLL